MESKQIFERKAGGRFAGAPWLGATVRLKKGKRTAKVTSDNVTIGNGRVDGVLQLDKPLAGFRYWNVSDLTMVAPNDPSSPTPLKAPVERNKDVGIPETADRKAGAAFGAAQWLGVWVFLATQLLTSVSLAFSIKSTPTILWAILSSLLWFFWCFVAGQFRNISNLVSGKSVFRSQIFSNFNE